MAGRKHDRVDLVVAQGGGLLGRLEFGGKREIGRRHANRLKQDFRRRPGSGTRIADIDFLALQVREGLYAGIGTREHGDDIGMG